MSFPIMPALPLSMAKGLKKNPRFNTVRQTAAAGRGNSSTSLMPYAVWDFEFDLDRVTGNEAAASSVIAQFLGTYMACNGSNGLFLFPDAQDNAVVYANSGMLNVTSGAAIPMGSAGDGASTQFQLARSIGGIAWDVIQNLNGSIVVKVNGSVVVPTSISSTGVVTFATAPAASATLQWQGSFYYLCRFSEDTVDATRAFTTNSGTDQWDVDSLKFSSEFV
jgi:hypothetical protein